MDAVQGGGVHDGVDASDGTIQVVRVTNIALDQLVSGINGPEVQQPEGVTGCG